MTCLSGSELQLWRREQLMGQQGQAAALDWLLELEAGLLWSELQASYLHPETTLQLRCSLQRLEQIWQQHCQQQVPLQHLVGRVLAGFGVGSQSCGAIPRQEKPSCWWSWRSAVLQPQLRPRLGRSRHGLGVCGLGVGAALAR